VWLALEMTDAGRNPCRRVRDWVCAQAARSPADGRLKMSCSLYESTLEESEKDTSPRMRSDIRAQCVSKIKRIKEEEGANVP
jgi:hypothetical protein